MIFVNDPLSSEQISRCNEEIDLWLKNKNFKRYRPEVMKKMNDSAPLSKLFQRLPIEHGKEIVETIRPYLPDVGAVVFEVRYQLYYEGYHDHLHDHPWLYTINIYLNDDYEGGEYEYKEENDYHEYHSDTRDHSLPTHSSKPHIGMMGIIDQNELHAVGAVTSGVRRSINIKAWDSTGPVDDRFVDYR